jgi:hypothetical protein
MTYKVVRNLNLGVVAFGPNDQNYEPTIKNGEVLTIEDVAPVPSLDAVVEAEKVSVRNQRDLLLAATDWTQLPDVPQAIKDKWVTHRKALRDVPQQAGFPFNVVWPT